MGNTVSEHLKEKLDMKPRAMTESSVLLMSRSLRYEGVS